jgi:hypothetical protein
MNPIAYFIFQMLTMYGVFLAMFGRKELHKRIKSLVDMEEKEMTDWRKPSVEATKHRHIVAIVKMIDRFDEESTEIKLLYFDGIKNRWHTPDWGSINIALSDILRWIPVPKEEE